MKNEILKNVNKNNGFGKKDIKSQLNNNSKERIIKNIKKSISSTLDNVTSEKECSRDNKPLKKELRMSSTTNLNNKISNHLNLNLKNLQRNVSCDRLISDKSETTE